MTEAKMVDNQHSLVCCIPEKIKSNEKKVIDRPWNSFLVEPFDADARCCGDVLLQQYISAGYTSFVPSEINTPACEAEERKKNKQAYCAEQPHGQTE